jgi:uncharacterized protein (TIGR02996 family)
MSSRTSFIAAIAAAPDDDLPRLVFADWLDEHGDPARAEFIRLQVAAAREAEQFPPVIDEQKLARIRELFLANYRDWLKPVYEAFRQPLPVLDRPPGEPRTWLGRRLRDVGQLFWVLSGRDFGGPNDEDDEDLGGEGFRVGSDGVTVYSHLVGSKTPLSAIGMHGGFVESLSLDVGELGVRGHWPEAVAAEPTTHLWVSLSDDLQLWRRIEGPHLTRVRAIGLRLYWGDRVTPAEFGQTFCRSRHLHSLRRLELRGDSGSAPFLDELRSSPLGRQLMRLTLRASREVWERLAHPDHGFESLQELLLDQSHGMDDQCPGGFADSLRRQLTRLVVDHSQSNTPGWLLNGSAWERLEHLELRGELLWDAGAIAFAGSEQFPALRVLHLSSNGITDAGAIALARSPWVLQLRALFFELNRITDAGAVELASLLDRGLRYLDLRCYFRGTGIEIVDECISLPTQRRLKERYGPRIAFPRPSDG